MSASARFALRMFFACAFSVAAVATAQQYPAKPVHVVIPFQPGSLLDVVARLTGDKVGEALGQKLVVENRTGANGNLAADLLAKAAPDGYTLMLAADSLIVINPHVYAKTSFDTLKDLVPVASVASNQFFLSVNPSVPVKTFQQFIDYARTAKPPLAYASGGSGSQHQFGMEMLKQRAGLEMTHVPYRSGGPAGAATIAGETQVVLAGASNAGNLRSGQLRGLATTGTHRSPAFPDLPTIAEFYPGYDLTIWLGLFAPPGVPEPIMTRLRTETHKALAQKDLVEKLNVTGRLEPLILSPAEFSALIRRDYEKYGKLVKDLGIKAE